MLIIVKNTQENKIIANIDNIEFVTHADDIEHDDENVMYVVGGSGERSRIEVTSSSDAFATVADAFLHDDEVLLVEDGVVKSYSTRWSLYAVSHQ